MSVIRQWLGTSGDVLGIKGKPGRTFFYSLGIAAAIVGAVNAINVITFQHGDPDHDLAGPLIGEASSWITFMLFFWLPWLGWRLAPPMVRPRWKLLVHIPIALGFSLAHVGGFTLIRKLIYGLAGSHYGSWDFFYEFRKDACGYALFFAGFTLIDRMLPQKAPSANPDRPMTFDIRDGAKLTRVELDEILAVASAGNYVEFVLRDERRLLMRSSLSAIESELATVGFLRTHRSWLVNTMHLTGLTPEGSGDYAVELRSLVVPLSRRFPAALAKLRRQ